jgi:hypothetical protein
VPPEFSEELRELRAANFAHGIEHVQITPASEEDSES